MKSEQRLMERCKPWIAFWSDSRQCLRQPEPTQATRHVSRFRSSVLRSTEWSLKTGWLKKGGRHERSTSPERIYGCRSRTESSRLCSHPGCSAVHPFHSTV